MWPCPAHSCSVTKSACPAPTRSSRSLDAPDRHVVVNLLGVPLKDRPAFFAAPAAAAAGVAGAGRPASLARGGRSPSPLSTRAGSTRTFMPKTLTDVILITVHPEHVAPAVLTGVSVVLGVGGSGEDAIRRFCTATGRCHPAAGRRHRSPPERRATGRQPAPARRSRSGSRRRAPSGSGTSASTRKASFGPDRSFYFRGPDDRLNLRAQNLAVFVQLADGVDDDTWRHHLRNGHYSRWFREAIKNDELADDAAAIEREDDLPARESRARIRAAIEQRYTLPA